MKKIILVHGWGATSKSDFFPWLKAQLKENGCEVIAPDMPDTESPDITKWVSKLTEVTGIPDTNTYFIGHSIGCQTILRYLERVDAQVGGAIFVAGWFNLDNLEDEEAVEIAKPWVETPIDTLKLKNVLPNSTLIISDNDPYGCFDENRERFSQFVTREVVVPNAGHFNPEDGYAEIPLVIEELERLVASPK